MYLLPICVMLAIWSFISLPLFSILISMFSISIYKLFTGRKSVIMLLLSLELLTLASIFTILISGSFFYVPSVYMFSVFTFSVCEASIGLSLLISKARLSGSDSLPVF